MLRVTCAIILKSGKILVVQNSADSDHPFQWEFPGGKIINNETEEECIIREIWEELKIEINVRMKMTQIKWDYGFREIELLPFLCTIKSGEIKLTEHIQFLWVDFKSLSDINFSGADLELIKLEDNQELLKKYLGENMYDT